MPNLELDHNETEQSLDSKEKNAKSDIKKIEQAQKELSSTKAPQAPTAKEASPPMPATNEAKAPDAATPKDSANKVTSKMPIANKDFFEKFQEQQLSSTGKFMSFTQREKRIDVLNPNSNKPFKIKGVAANPKTTQAPIPAEQAKITKNVLSARLEKVKKKDTGIYFTQKEVKQNIAESNKYTEPKANEPIARIAPEMFQK